MTSYVRSFNTNTQSRFQNNVSGQNGVFVTAEKQSSMILGQYTKLSKIINAINILLVEFSLGHFELVTSVLNQDLYNNLALQLSAIKQNSKVYPDFENIRISTTHALAGLTQGIQQYILLKNTQSDLTTFKTKASILDDKTKLQDYINSLLGSRSILPDSKVTIITAEIKPEYVEYIQLYGFPEGAIFEMDKLSISVASAKKKGLIL
jgi:hypothetical protein